MRFHKALVVFTLLAALVVVAPAAFADGVVQVFTNGQIDWSRLMITVTGVGAPPAQAANMAQARAMALRAATVVAQRNLLEIINGVQVTSQTIVKDFITQSDIIRTQVEGVVKGVRPVDIAYMSDGSVEVTVAMPLTGDLARMLIPMPTTMAPSAPQPAPSAPPPPPAPYAPPLPPTAPTPPPAAPAPSQMIYTGLVVDARGLGVRPAMSPKIVDESGAEVYGSTFVTRDYAIQQGVSGYAKDLSAAQNNPRVTDKPITVKGIKASGAARCDIVVSNADAQRLKDASQNLSFLQQCKVMIVLD